jgi:flagellar biosynthetic protein FliR
MIDLTAVALNLPIFFLVLCRAGGIMIAAPLLSHDTIPVRVKITLSMLLALVMYPFATQFSGPLPVSALALLPAVLKELGVGLIMGFAASLVIAALESAGSLAAQQIGITLSEIASPGFSDEESNQISAFLGILGLLLFLAVDGHHWFVEGLAASFRTIPVGRMPIRTELMASMSERFSMVFVYALRISAPLVAIMFLVNIAVAIMAKSVPQMNILMVGYPVKVGIGVAALLLTFPLMWPVMREAFARLQSDLLYFSRLL